MSTPDGESKSGDDPIKASSGSKRKPALVRPDSFKIPNSWLASAIARVAAKIKDFANILNIIKAKAAAGRRNRENAGRASDLVKKPTMLSLVSTYVNDRMSASI